MLFRPHTERRFLGIRLQGLVPRRQMELARSIGETVERELVSHRDLEQVLQSAHVQQALKTSMEEQVDVFLSKNLGRLPILGPLISEGIASQVKEQLLFQLKTAGPALIEDLLDHTQRELNFQKLVQSRIEAFDLGKLEKIIYEISARELKTIELLGGVLGFIVGLAQVAILIISR